MQSLRPESAAAMTAHRREAVRLAKSQEKAVSDKCIRAGQEPPGYAFDELIGKGSFGRVYKGRQNSSGKVVAVKVLDIDEADFQAFGDMRDEQIRDFNKEIAILRRAQESGAENLNQMIEALPVHSQLWLVCEYCPGGSVKTLMRATRDRLEEKYMIVVARELAKALKGLHQAGIMHRDVKAANVLIHESGGLQLCDFGIAAAIEGQTDKRRTFVGTLHWMPPELWADKPEYNDEVDVWGYGCTLYECATGTPPNSDVRERQQLKVRMRRLKQSIGLPEKEGMNFSEGLKSLVKFALNPDAASRPSMYDILQHDFLAGTEEQYPTSSLTELVQHYYGWLFGGGQRISLFMPGGAVAASELDEFGATMTEEWNFSMTQDFEKRVSTILEIPDFSILADFESDEGDATPRGAAENSIFRSPQQQPMTVTERANFDLRVQRGEGLANLFDQQRPAYEYRQKRDFIPVREPVNRTSDLPFRAMAEDRPMSTASVTLDLGDFDEEDYAIAAPRTGDDRIQTTYAAATPQKGEPAFILPDAATIRAKRADSKGPREGNDQSLTAKQPYSTEDVSDPTAEDWTAKRESNTPRLQDAVEITPTMPMHRPKERDTMGWSFADAMNAISQPNSPQEASSGERKATEEVSPSPEQEAKARKHATMQWSFSMAMAEADTEPEEETQEQRTPVHDAFDDFSSRPSTSMSGAYSESSASSTDFDPFSLDRRTPYEEDGPGDAEFDDIGLSDFYASRGRTMIPLDLSGPGPDIGVTITPHMNDQVSTSPYRASQAASGMENGIPYPGANGRNGSMATPTSARHSPRGPSSPRSLGHIRGNGSGASRGSGSSTGSGSARTTNNVSTSVGTSIDSGSSGLGVDGYNSHAVNLPIPAPPNLAAMSGDASPTTVQRELDRLLGEFQNALGVASDVISDAGRGRARRRKGMESGSEWEDED
ncbi:hypothetical protein LTR70_005124 [Exophiala xenobiotica]|uniref:non-specific serine/threonine protein kinase n=1 Tax=Lithohypha guttulata TaxID=1690604 RepID=A0ABR0KAP4_9EURO|nr:hypothetical protein LTR24_004849 [Lithohypha guttulata]KAK5319222.1 hypothetical protein LTR70_005124 [Exophiala xenobiotica]